MRYLAIVVALGLLAAGAQAETWYARGGFNNWDTSAPMTDNLDGTFTANIDISSQTPGTRYEFKVANADWSVSYPGSSNVLATYATGRPMNLDVFFEPLPDDLGEGWLPETNRVGYSPGGNPWKLVGDFSGWAPIDMTDLGNDFWTVDTTVPAGTSGFKFRGTDDWEISIGADFGKWAGNASMTVATGGLYRFELDLPHGRYRAFPIPEPASLLGLALLGMLIRRR